MRLLSYTFCIAMMVSCVPARLLDESKAKLNNCETELSSIKKTARDNETALQELREQEARNKKTIDGLTRDTTIVGSNLRNMSSKYDKLNVLNEQLMDRMNKLTPPSRTLTVIGTRHGVIAAPQL